MSVFGIIYQLENIKKVGNHEEKREEFRATINQNILLERSNIDVRPEFAL